MLCIAIFTSCNKLVDGGVNKTALGVNAVYTDSAATVAAVAGIYGVDFNGYGLTLNLSQYGSLSADEASFVNGSATNNAFATNSITPDLSNVIDYGAYKAIYAANQNILSIPKYHVVSTQLQNQLIGESKFLRAFCNFYNINFYGDMPLILNTDVLENGQASRTPSDQVYQQIVSDLKDAKNLLTDSYPSIEKARINKKAVSAFLARVYLYTKDYVNAENESTEVINSGLYSLESNLNNVFLKTSNEVIWQIESNYSSSVKGVTPMGNAWLPVSNIPVLVLNNPLVKAFESGDKRKASWTQNIVYNGTTYYYPYKYKYKSTTASGNEYSVMLRLGEQYLIRSEARARQNNIQGAQADLNIIRNRAGLGTTNASDLNSLILALEQERWVELFTENADRWLNLKRTGRISPVLKANKGNFQDYQALYPLPQADIVNDHNLKQNPGY